MVQRLVSITVIEYDPALRLLNVPSDRNVPPSMLNLYGDTPPEAEILTDPSADPKHEASTSVVMLPSRITGAALITISADEAEVHPAALVTV